MVPSESWHCELVSVEITIPTAFMSTNAKKQWLFAMLCVMMGRSAMI